jgi:hypothetical protein
VTAQFEHPHFADAGCVRQRDACISVAHVDDAACPAAARIGRPKKRAAFS